MDLRSCGEQLEATAVNNIGEILSDRGQLAAATQLFREALATFESAGYASGRALTTSNLGRGLPPRR